MTRKHDPPAGRDRPPAMLVGDEMAEALPAQMQATAAMLPDDLRVVIERTSTGRLLLITAGLLGALVLGVLGIEWMSEGSAADMEYGFVVVGVAALAWLAHRDAVRRRREFRLGNDGLTVEVTPLVGGPLRVTHVPWTEVADYTAVDEPEKVILQVVSVRGYTVTLKDRPPRLSTRELIRRFVEQAEQYPRAVGRKPRAEGSKLPDFTGERTPALGGCLTFFAITVGGASAEVFLGLSNAQELAAAAVVCLIVLPVVFWLDLDDPEITRNDAESKRLMARLRSWLRRVLRIRAD